MKITGIIAEYNPFHNGHLYQINSIKKETEDFVIVAMSGDFVQRGTPAIFNKYARTKMALLSGADVVLELPSVFATASAPYFAKGGVSLLDKLGCVNQLSFGVETADTEKLDTLSTFLSQNPFLYQSILEKELANGNSFPKARELAIQNTLGNDYAALLSTPNNILGLEYMIALKERNSNIKPLPLKRDGADYHEERILDNKNPSATAIRKNVVAYMTSLAKEKFDCAFDAMENIEKAIPPKAYHDLVHNHVLKDYLVSDDFSYALHTKLLTEAPNGFTDYADVSEVLSAKIINHLNQFQTISQFIDLLKSKELTHTRISRCLFHILLNIKEECYEAVKENDYVPYARILGFRKESTDVLSEIKKASTIPLISKLADASHSLDLYGTHILKQDILSSHLYQSAYINKKGTEFVSEYEQQIIKL